MSKASTGSKRLALAKQLKSRTDSFDIKLVRDYIESLKEEKYTALIKQTEDVEMSLLVGELRAYQKLLNSLSQNDVDTSVTTQVIGQ